MDDFFAPPPFKPGEALIQFKRTLRDLRGLTERTGSYEWKGKTVIACAVDGDTLSIKLAKRPAQSPEWEPRSVADHAQLRKLVDEIKARVGRWRDADE
jgi:hypothetical protein